MIRSKKSFAEVTTTIESMFQLFDLDKVRKLTEARDAKALAQYVDEVRKPHQLSIFFQMDQGSIIGRLGWNAGPPRPAAAFHSGHERGVLQSL
jgi:hypothetical protein